MPDAITAVPGIKVGHWSDRGGATGCTVVLCEDGAVAGYSSRGGAPGTIETDLLRPENAIAKVHAVLLTGGSAFGLAAAAGVREALAERGAGLRLALDLPPIPIVTGAVLFDLRIGSSTARPTAESGRLAAERAKSGAVAQGSVGAGTGCTVAKLAGAEFALKGGIGTAALAHRSGLVVGALTAVNCIGDVHDPDSGALIAGPRGQRRGELRSGADVLAAQAFPPQAAEAVTNTTIAVVATNARLDKAQATRLALMAEDGFARAIRPAHTPLDGDCVFALATGTLGVNLNLERLTLLGSMAATALADAVVRGVTESTRLAGVPAIRNWRAPAGH